jgi:uncharacterized protein YsxB (DUF464 family)
MVKADLYMDGSVIRGFIIEGHVESVAKGEYDLICASISAISQTALLGLDAFLTSKIQWKIEDDGCLECWLPEQISSEEEKNAQIILGTMELGLKCLEESYEQYLKVSKRRWTKCCSK